MKFLTIFIGVLAVASFASAKAIAQSQDEERIFGFINEVLVPAVNTQIQNVALLAAQVTAGIAVGGIDALTGLFGKRDASLEFTQEQQERILSFIKDQIVPALMPIIMQIASHINGNRQVSEERIFGFINQVLVPAVNTQIQNVALLAAQVTAGIAVGGIDALTGLIGKREVADEKIFGFIDQVLLPAINTQIQNVALLAAQVTAGIAVGGIDALTGLIGRRAADFFPQAEQEKLLQVFIPVITNVLISTIGKRDVNAEEKIMGFINQVLVPAVNTQIQNVALLAAQVTAGIAVGGIDALTGLIGKREAVPEEKIFGFINQVLVPAVNTQIQNVALLAAQVTAGIAVGGIDALTGLIGK